jgi:hypothetical protein
MTLVTGSMLCMEKCGVSIFTIISLIDACSRRYDGRYVIAVKPGC